MKKSEFIARYGEDAWARRLEQIREWRKNHLKQNRANARNWAIVNPDKREAINREVNRKGGRHYNKKLKYMRTGVPGERQRIRHKHGRQYYPFKMIIAPDSQIHHEWMPKTAEYRGVALVEANPHRYGIIDVIQILDGEITVLTEEEVRNGLEEKEES